MAERRSSRLLLLLLLASTPEDARAQAVEGAAVPPAAEAVSRWDRPWLIEGSMGIGTPVGLLGLQLERRFATSAALRAGLGWNGYGLHGAGMIRVRLPQAPALNLGAGVSGGPFHPLCIMCDEAAPTWDLAFFNNYELSAEARARTGFTFRIYLGWAWLMNTGAYDCPECEGERPTVPQGVPYFGLALGGAI